MFAWAFKNPQTLEEGNFKMLSAILKLILKVASENRHIISHIAYVHPKEGEKQIVSIWAGAGIAAEPINRISELIKENEKLKYHLSDMINNNKRIQ